MRTVLNVKMDMDIKNRAVMTAKEIGVPMSIVVNSLLRDFIEKREILITAPKIMSNELKKTIEKAEKDLKNKNNISPVFNNTRDALNWLNK